MGVVYLGMPGPWADDNHEASDHYTTKIGGVPDWPIPEIEIKADLLKCGLCGSRLCLVAQVYAPISLATLEVDERTIYILGCPVPTKCGGPASWRTLRFQKCRRGDPPSNASPVEMMTARTVSSSSVLETSNWWENDLEGHDGGGDSDEDLGELGRKLSEAASLVVHSNKQKGSTHSEAVKKDSQIQSRIVNTNIPVLPCFYIYSQKESSSFDVNVVCSSYSSLTIKDDQGTLADSGDEEIWEDEGYEYDRALSVDRTYLKFKKQMEAYPEQCFRYAYGGKPLLPTAVLGESCTCGLCGAPRHYEMQLMPPLLYYLNQGADDSSTYSSKDWNWMVLIIYTCSKSCFHSCEEKSGSSCWTVAEEATIVLCE